jgi:hypothetical protein
MVPGVVEHPAVMVSEMAPRPVAGEAAAIDELSRRGFTDAFRIVDGELQVLRTGEMLQPEDLVVREVYRFEGVSDPDDMSIVFGVESTGFRGIVVDAFGAYADPAKTAVLAGVPIRRLSYVG